MDILRRSDTSVDRIFEGPWISWVGD
jgi:hypothetical protein